MTIDKQLRSAGGDAWRRATLGLLATGLVLASVGGCTHTYEVRSPGTSAVRYAAPAATPVALSVADARVRGQFSQGEDAISVEFEGGGDELGFLQTHLRNELAARGIQVVKAPAAAEGHALSLKVRTFYIRHRHVSGFSPVVTFTNFASDVTDGRKVVRIAAYSKHAKLAVWSMDETEEPCYNLPLRVVVGEVAAKINRAFFGLASSDEHVANLAAQAGTDDSDAALSAVYALGFTNNPAAVPHLVRFAKHEAETFRAAALSGLGTLGAVEQLPNLIRVHQTGTSASDRYAALKAIADLGTPEAHAFLRTAHTSADASEQADLKEIADLYLHGLPETSVAQVPPPAPAAGPAPATAAPAGPADSEPVPSEPSPAPQPAPGPSNDGAVEPAA